MCMSQVSQITRKTAVLKEMKIEMKHWTHRFHSWFRFWRVPCKNFARRRKHRGANVETADDNKDLMRKKLGKAILRRKVH